MKKKLYGNYRVLNPNGEEMFKTGEKKFNWYLRKEIAFKVSENTIQLRFEPKGDGNKYEPFFLQQHKNQCVCCGSKEELTKHHIVPLCFRKFFEELQKSHNMHDVLLLCEFCHSSYEREADKIKNSLVNLKEFADKQTIRKHAITLLRYENDNSFPEERKTILKQKIAKFLNQENSDLKEADYHMVIEKINTLNPWKDFVLKHKNIQSFIEFWRNHFIVTLNPRFLPDFWSINYKRS